MFRASFRRWSIPRVLLLVFVGHLLFDHLSVYPESAAGALNRGSVALRQVAPRNGALPWEPQSLARGNGTGGVGGPWARVATSVLTCAGRCGSDLLLSDMQCLEARPPGVAQLHEEACRETQCVCGNAACSLPGTSFKCCPDLATACPFEMARSPAAHTVTAVEHVVGRQSKPPNAFPPRHHGKERSFVDAVFVHTDSHISARVGDVELVEWLEYMRYAGIGHFIMYDCRSPPRGSVSPELAPYIQEEYLDYTDWRGNAPARHHELPDQCQADAYADAASKSAQGLTAVWRGFLDPVDYPVVPNDEEPGFLTRLLSHLDQDVGMVYLDSYIFGGLESTSAGGVRRVAKYLWRTRDRIDGYRFLLKLSTATGVGIHRAGTSGTVLQANAHPAQLHTYVGSLLPARDPPCYDAGTIGEPCTPMVKDPKLAPVLQHLSRLMDANTLFPGIPSWRLRERLLASQKISGASIAAAAGGGGKIKDLPVHVDESNVAVWPPQ